MKTNKKVIIDTDAFEQAIEAQQRMMREVNEAYSKLVNPIEEAQKTLSRIYSNAFGTVTAIKSFYENLLPGIQKFYDFIENARQFRVREKKVLIESGWFISPAIGQFPYPWIVKSVNAYESGDRSSVTNLMKKVFGKNDWEYLGEVVEDWGSHRFFTDHRMQIIQDALEAHRSKKYTLSIPALLPIAEGICGDFCREQQIRVQSGSSYNKGTNALTSIKQKGDVYLSEVALSFIQNQLYVSTQQLKDSKNRKYLNRHGILHGSQTGYADCARSLRCFLLLDVLTLL